jgi:hypothetical protein
VSDQSTSANISSTLTLSGNVYNDNLINLKRPDERLVIIEYITAFNENFAQVGNLQERIFKMMKSVPKRDTRQTGGQIVRSHANSNSRVHHRGVSKFRFSHLHWLQTLIFSPMSTATLLQRLIVELERNMHVGARSDVTSQIFSRTSRVCSILRDHQALNSLFGKAHVSSFQHKHKHIPK